MADDVSVFVPAPVKPTVDPHPVSDPEKAVDSRTGKPLALDPVTRGRYRYYAVHAAEVLGYKSKPAFDQSLSLGRVPKADGYDEIQRPFWWLETLEGHLAQIEEQKQKAKAGPEPDGYTSEGQPYRLLPGDSYYAQKGEADGPKRSKTKGAEQPENRPWPALSTKIRGIVIRVKGCWSRSREAPVAALQRAGTNTPAIPEVFPEDP